MTTLSICIPCYNRAAYLPQTIASILSEWSDELEITIADNASSDETFGLVAELQKNHPNIKYFRWETNQGADLNYLKAVSMATGRYCWLLGSDDTLRPGAIANILKVLSQTDAKILLFDRMLCTRDLVPTKCDSYIQLGSKDGEYYQTGTESGMLGYLITSKSLACAFSYLSSMIFSKAAWDAVPTDQTFIGTAYIHVQKLLGVCVSGGNLYYIHKPFVNCRLGNDSFRDLGLAKRVLLDLEGYELLAQRCLRTWPQCALALKQLVLLEYPFGRMMRYKGILGADPKWPAIQQMLKERYQYPRTKLRLANFFGQFRVIVRLSFFIRDLKLRKSPV